MCVLREPPVKKILYWCENCNVPLIGRTCECGSRSREIPLLQPYDLRPALAAGKIVLCDRFGDSTLAYQGFGHQIDLDTLQMLLDFSTGGLKPDLTLLVDVPVEVGMERKRVNSTEWNRLDAYTLAFHERVRQGYFALAEAEPARWVIIDATKDKDSVQKALQTAVTSRLGGG